MLDLADVRAVLSRTPDTLDAWLAGLPSAWTTVDEGPDTFSPRDVVAHLTDGEVEDWIPRLERVLEHGEARPFEPFDRFGFRQRHAGRSLDQLLPAFRAARVRSLERLEAIAPGPTELARTGTHPELGRVTLAELLATWVVHDLSHLAQIARVMARRYGAAVGPWAAYLPILGR